MITPSFGLTATERVLPKIALDFTTASLDPRITFSRALNTATRINSSGYIEAVNADMPRFDYDPITLACKGLLIEESRINSLIYSDQFNISATWAPSANISVSSDVAVSPANTQTADKLINAVGASGESIAQLNSYTSGVTYTYSVFLKAAGNTTFILLANSNLFSDATFRFATFNLSNGTYTLGGGSGATATITAFSNSWYRCSLTFTPSVTISGAVQLRNNNVGNGVDGIFAWGAQCEIGAFPTSYIPTTTTSLTRNADVATMTGTNFSSWYNASEGAFSASGQRCVQGIASGVLLGVAETGVYGNSIYLVNDSSTSADLSAFVIAGGPQAILTKATTLTSKFNSSFAYKLNNFGFTTNAQSVATSTSGGVSSNISIFSIGSAPWAPGGALWNGHIAKINYYPQRLISAELQAFSK